MPRGKSTGLKRSNSGAAKEKDTKKAKTAEKEEHANGSKKTLDPSLLPTKIEYITVWSKDSAKSKDFYKEVFGMKSTCYNTEKEDETGTEWIELKPEQRLSDVQKNKALTTLSIHATEKEHEDLAGQVHLSVFVPDLTKYHEYLESRGDVEVVLAPKKEDWGGIKAEYKSPDGVRFSAVEDSRKPAGGAGICHCDIPVSDMDRAKKFYADVFGWKYTDYKPEYALYSTNSPDYDLQGGLSKEPHTINFPAVYLCVTDIDATLATVKKHGGEIIKTKAEIGPGIGSFAHFKDSEGNVMALWSK